MMPGMAEMAPIGDHLFQKDGENGVVKEGFLVKSG